MAKKPTYEELEQKVKELENKAFDRKQAQEALQENEERFRSLFSANRDGYIICLGDGEILDANPRMLEMLRYSTQVYHQNGTSHCNHLISVFFS